MSAEGLTQGHILCCMCGVAIPPNPSNMCVNCLKTQVDITEGIAKQVTMFFCRGCGRYQHQNWITAELESRELLSLCLKKIKGLNKEVKLVDAGFIWTEPHSRRLKVKLTIQKEVLNSAIMQQTFVVEFVCSPCQCPDCARSYTEHTWTATTQVRQKTKHKRTFFFLEQVLIKTGGAAKAIQVKEMPGGLDFFWLSKQDGVAMQNLIQEVVPTTMKESRKLITQDDHNNFKKYKFTQYVEISPVCKHDMCILPPKLAATMGGISPLVLCYRVSSALHLIDPLSLQMITVSAVQYFRYPFRPERTQEDLTKYVVLDIEKGESGNVQNKQNADNDRMTMAEVTVARDEDFGVNDTQFQLVTHLGHILKVGDTVAGYDLSACNFDGDEGLKKYKGTMPEIVLVKKIYTRNKRAARRQWKVKKLDIEGPDKVPKKSDLAKEEMDFEGFLQEIEEDGHVRAHVNLYKRDPPKRKGGKGGSAAAAGDEDEDEEDDLPDITDLLQDFNMDEKDPGDGEDTEPISFGTSSS